MTYLMSTRLRIVEFLRSCDEPVSFNVIRCLGTDRQIITWYSVVEVIKDLEYDKIVVVEKFSKGNMSANMVRWVR